MGIFLLIRSLTEFKGRFKAEMHDCYTYVLFLLVRNTCVDFDDYYSYLFLSEGLTEAMVTRQVLLSIHKGRRPFILSRSTFAGSGVHAAHWLGYNSATSDDLHFSIPGILNFQMFGIPLVGADICGFEGQNKMPPSPHYTWTVVLCDSTSLV